MLLTEQIFDTSVESINEGQEKNLYITGPFMQEEVVNRNRRIYPERILSPEVDMYINEYVNTKRAVGELEHPDRSTISPDRVSHLITEMYKDGHNYIGKAKILSTPMGQLVRSLLEGGVQMGVSSRGSGATKRRTDGINEVTKYSLKTVDIVYAPSAPDAFVATLVESESFAKVFENEMLLKEFDDFLAFRKKIKESKREDRYQLAIIEFDKLIKTF